MTDRVLCWKRRLSPYSIYQKFLCSAAFQIFFSSGEPSSDMALGFVYF
jgi:hypothetical protein